MQAFKIDLPDFNIAQSRPHLRLHASPSLRIASSNREVEIVSFAHLQELISSGSLWVSRTGLCYLDMSILVDDKPYLFSQQGLNEIAAAVEMIPLWCDLGIQLKSCQSPSSSPSQSQFSRYHHDMNATSQFLRFSLYSSDISASQVCPTEILSASADGIHLSLNFTSRTATSSPKNPHSPQSTTHTADTAQAGLHSQHPFTNRPPHYTFRDYNYDSSPELPFTRFSHNYIPSKPSSKSPTSRYQKSSQQTKYPQHQPRSVQPATIDPVISNAKDVIPFITSTLSHLFTSRRPAASRLRFSNSKHIVPLVKLLPAAFNLAYVQKVLDSVESMHVLSDVTSYFATSGSQGLRTSMRGLLDPDSGPLSTAIPRKLWSVLQSQTKIPTVSEIPKAISTRKIPDIDLDFELDFEVWDNLDDEFEEDTARAQVLPPMHLPSLSDIEVDDEDEFDLSPLSSQDTVFSSESNRGQISTSEMDVNFALGFGGRAQRDADLNFDVNFDDDEDMNDPESYVNCLRPQSFEDTYVPDIWEYDEGFGDDMDGLSDDGLDGAILDEMDGGYSGDDLFNAYGQCQNESNGFAFSLGMDLDDLEVGV